MKLTENQKIVLKTVLVKTPFVDVVREWEMAHDRNLVLDELLELLKKLKITIKKDYVKRLREIADMGKK